MFYESRKKTAHKVAERHRETTIAPHRPFHDFIHD